MYAAKLTRRERSSSQNIPHSHSFTVATSTRRLLYSIRSYISGSPTKGTVGVNAQPKATNSEIKDQVLKARFVALASVDGGNVGGSVLGQK